LRQRRLVVFIDDLDLRREFWLRNVHVANINPGWTTDPLNRDFVNDINLQTLAIQQRLT
jgi:hypothetical protein